MSATNFDEGLTFILKRKYNQTGQHYALTVRLYTAISAAIAKTTIKSHFTEVGLVMGYVAKTIGTGDFGFSLDAGNHWVIGSATYTWNFTAGAGLTILGWYVTDDGNTNAIMGEAFASSIVIPAAGGSLQVNINDKYKDC